MRVALRGINTVRKRLSSGRLVLYYYHRETGVRLEGEPNSPEFIASYSRAEQLVRDRHTTGVFASLSRDYMRSPEFRTQLADSTKREYARKLAFAEAEFADLPIAALNNPRVKAPLMAWRAKVAETSGAREADYRLSVISAMLSWAVDNGVIETNHLKGFKRLYRSNRADVIWLPENIEAFMSAAPVEMQQALILALHTGLRQGDLRKLCWSNYDGTHLTLRIGKNQRGGVQGPLVHIPCTRALRSMLDGMERRAAVILTTKEGRPFTARYFGHQWEKAMVAAGMETSPLHFHDLRGTAVTMLAEAGCSVAQIVAITQHSLATATRILEVYLSPTKHLANQAIAQFENAKETEFANRLQTSATAPLSNTNRKG
jgi:integrase